MARSKNRSESRRISLGSDLRIARAAEVTALLAGAAGATSLEIDAAQVERVDAAGLQALVAGLGRIKAANIACRWGGVSPALASSAAVAGLDDVLELPR
jgi:anti-anti-sigma regulatory factor